VRKPWTVVPGNPMALSGERAAAVVGLVRRGLTWVADDALRSFEAIAAGGSNIEGYRAAYAKLKREYRDLTACWVNRGGWPAVPTRGPVSVRTLDRAATLLKALHALAWSLALPDEAREWREDSAQFDGISAECSGLSDDEIRKQCERMKLESLWYHLKKSKDSREYYEGQGAMMAKTKAGHG
jgi:hypothetical protein